MKRLVIILLSASAMLTSCNLFNNYGKKVFIGDKSIVYYKGDGVTEADAIKLAKYFKKSGAFDDKDEKAVQLTKDGDAYVVRLPMKEGILEKDGERYKTLFWFWQDLISENVFDGNTTNVILTDNKFKDLVTLEPMHKITVGKTHHVYYKGKGIKAKDAKAIADKFEKEQIFPYTAGDVLLTRENDALDVRFLPSDEKMKDAKLYYATLKNLQYLIGKYVLDDENVKLFIIDDQFNDIRIFSTLSSEEKTALDQRMKGTQQQTDTNAQYNQTQYQQPNNGGGTVVGGGL